MLTRKRSPFAIVVPAAALAVCALQAGCSPMVAQRGYVPTPEALDGLSPGQDNKRSVLQTLGSPSTVATFDDGTWYYIAQTEERNMFFQPEVKDRTVVAVQFDTGGTLSRVNQYGVEDGQVIDLVTRQTPTHGRDLNFVQELFGNLGRFNEAASANPLERIQDARERNSRSN